MNQVITLTIIHRLFLRPWVNVMQKILKMITNYRHHSPNNSSLLVVFPIKYKSFTSALHIHNLVPPSYSAHKPFAPPATQYRISSGNLHSEFKSGITNWIAPPNEFCLRLMVAVTQNRDTLNKPDTEITLSFFGLLPWEVKQLLKKLQKPYFSNTNLIIFSSYTCMSSFYLPLNTNCPCISHQA